MATKILRPVPTFEQVIRLPDPVVNRPLRIPEVSRPHFARLLDLNATMHAHSLHEASTRMASAQYGVPMDTMRGAQQAAASAAASADVTMGTAAGPSTPDVIMGDGNRPMGAAPGAAAPAAPGAAPPAAPAAAPTPFDRPAFVQELINHNIETEQRQTRQFQEGLRAFAEEQAAQQKAFAERMAAAAKHRDEHQPFQDMTQQQAAAIAQLTALSQETGAVAAEMRESNRDQRAFMRANDEQMAQLRFLAGRAATPADLETAVHLMASAGGEMGRGLSQNIFDAASQVSNALQEQARQMARLNPPAKETREFGTDIPDLSAGAVPGGSSSDPAGGSSSRGARPPTRSETQYRRNVRGSAPMAAAARAARRITGEEEAPSRFELRLQERAQNALKDIVRTPGALAEVLQRVPQDSQHERNIQARAQRARDERRGDRERTQQSGRAGAVTASRTAAAAASGAAPPPRTVDRKTTMSRRLSGQPVDDV